MKCGVSSIGVSDNIEDCSEDAEYVVRDLESATCGDEPSRTEDLFLCEVHMEGVKKAFPELTIEPAD